MPKFLRCKYFCPLTVAPGSQGPAVWLFCSGADSALASLEDCKWPLDVIASSLIRRRSTVAIRGMNIEGSRVKRIFGVLEGGCAEISLHSTHPPKNSYITCQVVKWRLARSRSSAKNLGAYSFRYSCKYVVSNASGAGIVSLWWASWNAWARVAPYGGRRLTVGQNQTTKLIFLNFNKFRVKHP